MKSSDRNVDSMAGTGARPHRRDPRRSPGLFFLHVLLIVVLLAVACATVAVRTLGEGRAGPAGRAAVVLPEDIRGASASAAGGSDSLGPLSGPPSPPASLDSALKASGYEVPENASAYAVRVVEGPESRIYEQYEAGGGSLAGDFWPASSIKVLAALGALDFARSLGYSGGAMVSFDDGGPSRTLRSIYEPAIRDSSNYDYDLLVRIAGLDRLNGEFLTARNGFAVTSISRSYSGLEFRESPAIIIEEGDRRTYVPVRSAERDPECKAGNCSNLFEMTESVRRIVLSDQLPPEQRFDLHPDDLETLTGALLESEGFFADAVTGALGAGARIYSKPGDADGLDCLDVAFVESKGGKRFLVAATVPHSSGGCDALARLAKGVLEIVSA
ncbi:MAG TPA: serine hydrolase [Acidimicrobiales bacterium]|nr:serine hydrolase [Acidimicrobiales bacterium]